MVRLFAKHLYNFLSQSRLCIREDCPGSLQLFIWRCGTFANMDYPAISLGHWVCLDVLIVYALFRAASLNGLWDEWKPYLGLSRRPLRTMTLCTDPRGIMQLGNSRQAAGQLLLLSPGLPREGSYHLRPTRLAAVLQEACSMSNRRLLGDTKIPPCLNARCVKIAATDEV